MIFIEAVFLKLFIKEIKWLKHLLFSTIINLISSVPGVWVTISTMHLCGPVLPLIFLGLIFQLILIPLIYRKYVNWFKGLGVGIVVNIFSYIGVMIISAVISMIISNCYYQIEKHKDYKGKDSDIVLRDEIGTIYAAKTDGKFNHSLKSYNIGQAKWSTENTSNADFPLFYNRGWDISDKYLAYPTGSEFLIYPRKDYRRVISSISVEADELQFSPNGKYIAALREDEKISYKRDMTNFEGGVVVSQNGTPVKSLGRKSTVVIVDLDSHQKTQIDDNILIFNDGISWSKNSEKLLFSSIEVPSANLIYGSNDSSYSGIILEKPKSKFLFEYDITSNTYERLIEGYCGRYSPDGKSILFIKDDSFMLYDVDTKEVRTLNEIYCKNPMPQWSPSGKSIVAFENIKGGGFKQIFSRRIYVMSIDKPDEMLIIGNASEYNGLHWISE